MYQNLYRITLNKIRIVVVIKVENNPYKIKIIRAGVDNFGVLVFIIFLASIGFLLSSAWESMLGTLLYFVCSLLILIVYYLSQATKIIINRYRLVIVTPVNIKKYAFSESFSVRFAAHYMSRIAYFRVYKKNKFKRLFMMMINHTNHGGFYETKLMIETKLDKAR